MGRKHSQEFISDTLFEKYNVKVLSVYVNNRTPLTLLCACGNIFEKCYHDITGSDKCKCSECSEKLYGKQHKYTEHELSEITKSFGCEYILGSYVSCLIPFKFICTCGNTDSRPINEFRKVPMCKKCSLKGRIKKRKHSESYIKEVLESNGCELLGRYVNSRTRFKFKCGCGNVGFKTFNDMKIRGIHCRECGIRSRSGENSPRWNSELNDGDRRDRRKIAENIHWRKGVFERDNYTCQVCGDDRGGNLEAHHLEGYMTKVGRPLRFVTENGITLCDFCHKDFHMAYGYGDNTKDQFEKYINNKRIDNGKDHT